MKLHRLCLTAIGPFADRVEIDFSRFGDSGLFLLEGPTGSGKSTVIDAISFALYGKLAQSSAALERLKSHHSAVGTEPVVELVFETQSGLYRIRRTPTFERPKKRGTGNLTVTMTVKLWRLTSPDQLDGGELISNNLADAEDEITRAVGLSHPQFVQTVVLPQGEFANFLRSDTTTKRALLQRLFGTELLARTQHELVEARRLAEQRCTEATAAVHHAAHALIGAAALDEHSAAELLHESELADPQSRLGAVLGSIRAGLLAEDLAAAERHALATERRLNEHAGLRAAQDRLRRRTTRDELRQRELLLAGAAEAQQAARAELAAAERALRMVSAADSLGLALRRSEQAQKADADARAQLATPLADADESALRAAAAAHRMTLGQLGDAARREHELLDRRAELAELARGLAARRREHERAADELATLPGREFELTSARSAAAAVADQLPQLTAEHERAGLRLIAAQRAERAAALAATEEQLTREALEACERQESRLIALNNGWRASIAGELGLALKSGDPCAVCGSVRHPRPARPDTDHVSQRDVNSAESELRRLRGTVEKCGAQLHQQQNELAQLRVAADQLSPAQAQAQLAKLATGLAVARAGAQRLPELDAELAAAAERTSALSEQVRAAMLAETRLAERSDLLSTRIEQDELSVALARAEFASVAERVEALRDEIELVEATEHTRAAVRVAVAAAVEAGSSFATALATAEFDSESDWRGARRDSSELARLRQQIRDYDSRLTTVLARLADPELQGHELDAPLPDLQLLAEQVQAADAEERGDAARHGAAADRLGSADTQAAALERAQRRGARVRAETAPAIRIGYLVAGLGDNQLKMELTTYVLVRRFAEIVSAANSQLRRISGGRYELRHTDARSGNSRSGLGLLVLDLHTGRPRDPGTLSGGETFYVSLSLALGLADIVRAESGGVDLGTLFIDEGFGSLDPEVLDQVLAVLDTLREGGRSVGVVSHVAELKSRIGDRIQVLRNPNGSSRLVSTAG